MKNSLILFAGVLIISVCSVASYAQVKSDYDNTIDFTKYHTYTFLGWQHNSDSIVNDIDKKRVLDALQSEFKSRGLTLVESGGDAAISIFIVINNKSTTTAYTNYNGGMGYGGGFGWGMGAGMGMGSSTTTYSEDDYKQGTFVVDVYDEGTKKLAWQGVLTTVLKDNPQKREKTIPSNIAKLMKKYPVKATK